MRTYSVTIKPVSAFSNRPSSDTLFGAICWGLRAVYGRSKLEELLADFGNHEWRFVVSSAYPRSASGLRYYPKPLLPKVETARLEATARLLKPSGANDSLKSRMVRLISLYKRFRSCQFVSEELFEAFLLGQSEENTFIGFLEALGEVKPTGLKAVHVVGGQALSTSATEVDARWWTHATVQRNRIERTLMATGQSGDVYYAESVAFNERMYLHFWINTRDVRPIACALRYLEDRGLGGDRSVGRGQFLLESISEEPIPICNGPQIVLLSRLLPAPGEVDWGKPASYEVAPFRSKVESAEEFAGEDIWKAPVVYITEGSVLTWAQHKAFYGILPEVKRVAGKSILQDGLALCAFGKVAI